MSTRRHFLKMAGSTAALGIIQLRCSSTTTAASGPVGAGNVSGVPVGHLDFLSGQSVILGRDADGLYAMTAICPHEDCDMTHNGGIRSGEVTCSCHGSRFDANGSVTQGPARTSLEHYRVELASDGTITVQAGTVVAASVRTKVPA